MVQDIVINVEKVSKKFCKDLRTSMFYGVVDITRNMLGLSSRPGQLRKKEFWAVDDVSFEVRRGETLGLIGPNGSGKTTILKMINGIFWPDKGKITVRGKVGALIAVGAGFHQDLTGRENIYLNGAILGMNRHEMRKKFDAIVDFADIGDFLDTSVKHYSSGMYVRLGFAIAVHCEPEVLLVDEVLAVGDMNFQRKCLEKIRELRDKGITIIFVSHNLVQMEYVCSRCIFLYHGKIIKAGPTKDVIAGYVDFVNEKQALDKRSKTEVVSTGEKGTGEVLIKSVKLMNSKGEETDRYQTHDEVRIVLAYEAYQRIERPNFIFILNFMGNFRVVHMNSKVQNTSPDFIKGGEGTVMCTIKALPLLPNAYTLDVYIRDYKKGFFFDLRRNALTMTVLSPEDSTFAYRASGDMGIVTVVPEWNYL